MEIRFTLEDIRKYFNKRGTNYHSETSAQFVRKYPYGSDGHLDVNLSSEFTELIRQAARCNRYSSDIVYDIGNVNDAMEVWTGGKTLFVFGFRRDGVDGNSFVLSRVNNECKEIHNIHNLYFSIFFMEVKKDEGYVDFYKVVTDGYYL